MRKNRKFFKIAFSAVLLLFVCFSGASFAAWVVTDSTLSGNLISTGSVYVQFDGAEKSAVKYFDVNELMGYNGAAFDASTPLDDILANTHDDNKALQIASAKIGVEHSDSKDDQTIPGFITFGNDPTAYDADVASHMQIAVYKYDANGENPTKVVFGVTLSALVADAPLALKSYPINFNVTKGAETPQFFHVIAWLPKPVPANAEGKTCAFAIWFNGEGGLKLAEPTGLGISGSDYTWSPVNGTSTYHVLYEKIDTGGAVLETLHDAEITGTTFNGLVKNNMEEARYRVTVKAIAEGESFEDSEPASATYDVTTPQFDTGSITYAEGTFTLPAIASGVGIDVQLNRSTYYINGDTMLLGEQAGIASGGTYAVDAALRGHFKLRATVKGNGVTTTLSGATIDSAEQFVNGVGTMADPFLVYDQTTFLNVANDLTANYKQICDIALIGATTIAGSFTGSYTGLNIINDGSNPTDYKCKITGITETLFNNVASSGSVSSLDITAVIALNATANLNEKGVIANTLNGKIDNTVANVTMTTGTGVFGRYSIGGIVGFNGGQITKCTANGTINITGTSSNVGGIAGSCWGGTTENCVNNIAITTAGSNVGGIVGLLETGVVAYSTNNGAISAGDITGGIVGYAQAKDGYEDSLVEYCLNSASATISGGASVGGIIGLGDFTFRNSLGDTAEYKIESEVYYCINEAAVTGTKGAVGGIAGATRGEIGNCINRGNVTIVGGEYVAYEGDTSYNSVGGIAGTMLGLSSDYWFGGVMFSSYNTGNVTGGTVTFAGGLVGAFHGRRYIGNSYSEGTVTSGGTTGLLIGACWNWGNDSHRGEVVNSCAFGAGTLFTTNVNIKTDTNNALYAAGAYSTAIAASGALYGQGYQISNSKLVLAWELSNLPHEQVGANGVRQTAAP